MTDKQFITWLLKIDKAPMSPEKKFALQSCFTSMRYLESKVFSPSDYQKVFDDFLNSLSFY